MRAGRGSSAGPKAERGSRPERWSVESAGDDVAQLDIPADASRERTFEVYCSLAVRRREGASATHSLCVLVDGAQEWSRRVPTHDGPRDTLEVRLRRTVPVGRPLRIGAIGQAEGGAVLRLSIVAEEDD